MLLLLADSQIGRVWRLVANDREVFRQGSFVSVLRDAQRIDAIGAITAQVCLYLCSLGLNLCFFYYLIYWCVFLSGLK